MESGSGDAFLFYLNLMPCSYERQDFWVFFLVGEANVEELIIVVFDELVDEPDVFIAENIEDFLYLLSVEALDVYCFEIPSQQLAPAFIHSFVIDFDDNEVVTSIDDVRIANGGQTDSWYSFDGRRLDRKPSVKGVYIHNGNKVIVK